MTYTEMSDPKTSEPCDGEVLSLGSLCPVSVPTWAVFNNPPEKDHEPVIVWAVVRRYMRGIPDRPEFDSVEGLVFLDGSLCPAETLTNFEGYSTCPPLVLGVAEGGTDRPIPTLDNVLAKLRRRVGQGKPANITGDEARFLVDLLGARP